MICFFGWLCSLISMCEDMTLPELRTEWEQLNRLREEFQDAANAFEKILDGDSAVTSSRKYHFEEITFNELVITPGLRLFKFYRWFVICKITLKKTSILHLRFCFLKSMRKIANTHPPGGAESAAGNVCQHGSELCTRGVERSSGSAASCVAQPNP